MLPSEALVLRPYDEDDSRFIRALAEEAFAEFSTDAGAHTLRLVRRSMTLVAWLARGPRAERPSPGALAAQLGEDVRGVGPHHARVGFAAIAVEGEGVLALNAIAVVRSERGRGVGLRMMQAFERIGRARGARRLELCTADYNLAALDLFLRSGFRMVRRRLDYYGRGQDGCLLVKSLD